MGIKPITDDANSTDNRPDECKVYPAETPSYFHSKLENNNNTNNDTMKVIVTSQNQNFNTYV